VEILRDPEPQILFDPEVKNPQPLKTEVERRFRFTLLGGGQTTVIEHFKLWRLNPADKWQFHRERQDLRVTADVGEGLKRFTGIIKAPSPSNTPTRCCSSPERRKRLPTV
jgi:hypothetical protein